MSTNNWRNMQVEEIKDVLAGLLRQQFKLRVKKSSGEFSQFDKIKKTRRDIARVMTILKEKEIKAKT